MQEARTRLDRESIPATISEFWALKLGPLAFAPKVPEIARASVRQYDMRRIIAWMKKPDRARVAGVNAGVLAGTPVVIRAAAGTQTAVR